MIIKLALLVIIVLMIYFLQSVYSGVREREFRAYNKGYSDAINGFTEVLVNRKSFKIIERF